MCVVAGYFFFRRNLAAKTGRATVARLSPRTNWLISVAVFIDRSRAMAIVTLYDVLLLPVLAADGRPVTLGLAAVRLRVVVGLAAARVDVRLVAVAAGLRAGAFAAGENYFPEQLQDAEFYYPQDVGLEAKIREKLERAGLVADRIDYAYGRFGTVAWTLSIKWPMLMLNTSFLLVLLLPFYYAVTLPISLVLNALDVSSTNPTGTGLIVVARRP